MNVQVQNAPPLSTAFDWITIFLCMPLCSLCNEESDEERQENANEECQSPNILQMDRPIQLNPMPLHAYAQLISRDQAASKE